MAVNLSAWRKDWPKDPCDPCGLSAYILPSEDLPIEPAQAVMTVRVWVGPPTDRIRLDVTSSSAHAVAGEVVDVFLEVWAAAGCQEPGILGVAGHWVINPNDPLGAIVQVSGLLTDSWQLKARLDPNQWSHGRVKVGIRAIVDRVGGPFEVRRGLLI